MNRAARLGELFVAGLFLGLHTEFVYEGEHHYLAGAFLVVGVLFAVDAWRS
jgi:hypothetical protein